MSANPTRIERFIHDLGMASRNVESAPTRQASPAIENFLAELDLVYSKALAKQQAVSPVPDSMLNEMGQSLQGIRSSVLIRLGGRDWLKKIPVRDPLRNPVSLFGTLDLGLHEVAHTRALAWLMDPRNTDHGFRSTLLDPFLKRIGSWKGDAQLDLATVSVQPEKWDKEDRSRFDIYIEGERILAGGVRTKWEVFVEAKINAEEGEDQCARYEREAAPGRESLFVFLTPDGRRPDTAGRKQNWEPISFIELITLFRAHLPELEDKPGIDFLRLYMTGVLKDLYGLPCGKSQDVLEDADIYRVGKYLSLLTKGDN